MFDTFTFSGVTITAEADENGFIKLTIDADDSVEQLQVFYEEREVFGIG